ncbi:ribbon-helix-helix protein, CopG family [Sphingomonas sp. RT2P30]|uniref:CopG family ribbon-helix-helix protein n=1 Tax=Parasphingomonas halimpatiens TaxID=3096162 RepID=UPI002FCCB1B1
MSKTSVITARIDADLSDRLDALAAKLDRSRAWIMSKAIERFVDEETAFRAFIQEGIDAADCGEVYSQEEMEAWVEGLRHQTAAE